MENLYAALSSSPQKDPLSARKDQVAQEKHLITLCNRDETAGFRRVPVQPLRTSEALQPIAIMPPISGART